MIVFLLVAVVVIYPAVRICGKAGFPPMLGILAALPGINLLLLWFLALAEWPRDRGSS